MVDVTAFADLVAPRDPRTDWVVPAPGELPVRAHLEPLVTRVLAPNPSGMTLDGTNSYLVGDPASGQLALVDPGPDDPRHLSAVTDALAERGARLSMILVTHHHLDHAEAAIPWGRRFDAAVAAADPVVAGPGGTVLEPGTSVRTGGISVEVVATPGHCGDHLAFRLESGAVLVGDHVLGRGTSVVTHPEGDLLAYLESLRVVHDLGPAALYPGHGPELTEDPLAVLDFYREHRGYREAQILALVTEAPRSVRGLVEVIYAAVEESLWFAAEQSTRAAVTKLVADRRVSLHEDLVSLVG